MIFAPSPFKSGEFSQNDVLHMKLTPMQHISIIISLIIPDVHSHVSEIRCSNIKKKYH